MNVCTSMLKLLGQNISPLGLPWWSNGEDSVFSLQGGGEGSDPLSGN